MSDLRYAITELWQESAELELLLDVAPRSVLWAVNNVETPTGRRFNDLGIDSLVATTMVLRRSTARWALELEED